MLDLFVFSLHNFDIRDKLLCENNTVEADRSPAKELVSALDGIFPMDLKSKAWGRSIARQVGVYRTGQIVFMGTYAELSVDEFRVLPLQFSDL